jgi:hypothetical protein
MRPWQGCATRSRRVAGGLLALCGVTLALGASGSTAAADTTLGSTLQDANESFFSGAKLTAYQEAAPSEVLTAPSGGTITSWSVRSHDANAKYELRIMRPAPGGELTAAGTSSAQTIAGSEDKQRGPFAVSLAVRAGDRIGLQVLSGEGAPISNALGALTDELNYVDDPFADGTTNAPKLMPGHGGGQELLLQANFVPGLPVNTALPLISGEARAGIGLTATEGGWENATLFAFQWSRCTGASCTAIGGASGRTYTPTTQDEGAQLRVDVTASGEGGKATASSGLTDGVKPGLPAPPSNTAPPQLSGQARDDEPLTATLGNWTGGVVSFQNQWLRCASASGANCTPIAGATGTTYTPTHGDVGSTMRFHVIATNAAGSSSAESAPSAIVQRLLIKASLSLNPQQACTGTETELNGSASRTPDPPLRYRFSDIDVKPLELLFVGLGNDLQEAPETLAAAPHHELLDGLDSSPTVVFTWNRFSDNSDGPHVRPGSYTFDAKLVTLTVTDAAGASASATQVLLPAQTYSYEPRSKCPLGAHAFSASKLVAAGRIAVNNRSLVTSVSCLSVPACAGSISVVVDHRLLAHRAASSRARAKPAVIANTAFFSIPGHRTGKLAVKLTKTGRSLLKRGKRVKATLRLTSVSPLGRASTRSSHITLRKK